MVGWTDGLDAHACELLLFFLSWDDPSNCILLAKPLVYQLLFGVLEGAKLSMHMSFFPFVT